MRKFKILPLLLLLLTMATSVAAQKKTQKTYIPWNNGKLVVSEEALLSFGWEKPVGYCPNA